MESMVSDHFWRDRRVFVTGASGLLGSWLVKALLQLQADVIILLRDWVPNSLLVQENILQQTTIIRGDLSEVAFLERILNEYEVATLFHLAAQTIVPIANANPLSTFESNIAGTWNLLEASRRCSKTIAQIVIASSDKAYGEVKNLPYREDTPLAATYPYDVSKACADMLGLCYANTWGLPVAITRCGNFFGGGDLNWNRIIPGTIRHLTRGERPRIRSNGKLLRDYIYIEDAVNAYLSLARKMAENPALLGQAFNFSNGVPMNVLDLVEKLTMRMGSSLQPIVLDEACGEIASQYLDATKAFELLNWQPTFGIDKGLQQTISWYKQFFLNHHDALS